MKKLLLFSVLSFYLFSCSSQSVFTKDVLKANSGNRIFMNNESIGLVNTIDSAAVSKQIRRMDNEIVSLNDNITTYTNLIEKVRKGSYSSADASNLTSDCEKNIRDNQKSIDENNETKILLNKLALTYGGYVISIKRTDNVTPEGYYIPERFIIDNNYKFVSKSLDLPFFAH